MVPKPGDVVLHRDLGRGRVIVVTGGQVRVKFEQATCWMWPEYLTKAEVNDGANNFGRVHSGNVDGGVLQPVPGGQRGKPAGGRGEKKGRRDC